MVDTQGTPATRYVATAGGHVAYQVFGDGPAGVLFISNWLTNLDVMWDEPALAAYLRRLGSFGRVVYFDKRGSGVSDAIALDALPTLEQWMDDAVAALDASGVATVAVIGDTEGGPMAMLFAAEILGLTAPSLADDEQARRWFTRYQRLAMPPTAAEVTYRWVVSLDVRDVLPSISVPTLVLHRRDARHHRIAFGRYLADRIPGARFVELEGADTLPFHAGDTEPLLSAVEVFLTGTQHRPSATRRLATVLMSDVVGSTALASELGDTRWRELLRAHDTVVRGALARFRGEELAHTGDGIVASFDGPTRAVTCAQFMIDALADLGLTVRIGLHAGEIESGPEGTTGLAMHVAARVMAVASDGGILASRTVRDLVFGSDVAFVDRGEHELRGVPGLWSLFEVTDTQHGSRTSSRRARPREPGSSRA